MPGERLSPDPDSGHPHPARLDDTGHPHPARLDDTTRLRPVQLDDTTRLRPVQLGDTTRLRPVRLDDLLPLTPAQTGMLFESISSSDPALYYEQVRFDVVGPLDLDRFRSAWEAAFSRHDALRTVFCWDGLDEPVAVIRPDQFAAWNVTDRRADATGETTPDLACLDPQALAIRSEGIDVQRGPLSRFDLFRLDDDRTHVIWGFHHLLLDGWSTAQVVGEVLAEYDRSPNPDADEPPRATSPRPYLEWLADQDEAAATRFWRALLRETNEPTLLADAVGPTPRPADRPEPDDRSPAFVRGRIDAAVTLGDAAMVRAAAAEHRVTVNTMMQAAWARTLARWTDTDRVTFGVTISGRPAELDGSSDMVGMFLNTLPFPITVPDPGVDHGPWLQTIQGQQLDVSAYGHASLAAVQRLAPTAAGTLFDSILIFENYPARRSATDATVSVERYGVFEQTHYPLAIMAGDTDGSLGCIVVYDQAVFAPWLARQLVDEFLDQLVALARPALSQPLVSEPAVAEPGVPEPGVSESTPADVLRQHDRQHDSIATGSAELAASIGESLERATVASAFAHRAVLNANDVAVRYGDDALTFAELDERAAAVAVALQRRGVGPEVPVGVAIERSIDQVVAIVGIVMAGGCYLPLDPSNPPVRLAAILDDAGAPLILTAGDDSPLPSTRPPVSILDLATLAGEIAPTARPDAVEPDPESTLFLTFTSGSTGRPKGVPVHNRGVLHRLAWQYLTYPPAPGEIGIAKTTLGFVDHLSELWGPLLAGQTVVLAPDAVVKDVPRFIELCAASEIRRLVVVPSYLEALLESAPDLGARLPSLELLTTSGEALSAPLAARAARALPGVTLLNIYGMSEATADVTVTEIRLDADTFPEADADPHLGTGTAAPNSIDVGRPLPGLTVAITDRHGVPLPRGVIGSIDVSGLALSAGYWKRPDLTAKSFVERDGVRWYRTGDRGWMAPTGEVHLVGRADRQIKIRGMRVELGEVESAMERHGRIDRCVVAHRASGDLIAFVIGAAEPSESRSHARSELPAHMVPTAFVTLPELPVTHNGKLDRAALDRLALDVRVGVGDGDAESPDGTIVANGRTAEPDTAATAQMIELWRGVLPDATIGPATDFFDAGGHSLLALRLMNRINTRFDAELSLAQILEAPTPRTLAELVDPDRGSVPVAQPVADVEYLVPILPRPPGRADHRRTLFCVHGAGGNVLNFRALGRAIESDLELIGIQARGVDGVSDTHPDMAALVADYVDAIRAHQPHGPYLLAGYSGGGTIAVEIARELESQGLEVEATLLLDTFHNESRPQPFSRAEHLRQLRAQGPRYLIDRVAEKVRPSESEQHADIVAAARAEGRPIPLDSREWFLKGRLYELIGSHPIRPYDGTVVLLAATETHPGLVHMGHDHGLAEVFPNLEIIDVEGDHHSLVEGHNAPELGRLILGRIGTTTDQTSSIAPLADGVSLPSQDSQPTGPTPDLDAQQHVYRHLPSGLDESPLLTRFVAPGSSVLDVGTAATGRSALALRALDAQVTSIEYNHQAITEFARDADASVDIDLATADMVRLPFADASFDGVVVAFHGFDYLVDTDRRAQAIAELARVLRPGGHLIVNSYNTLGILTDPTTARSLSNWKRRIRFVLSGEVSARRVLDDNGLALHHARPGQLIDEFEGTDMLRFETITPLNGAKRNRFLVRLLAPEPNYVFTRT